jgi:cytochrome c peroxidase
MHRLALTSLLVIAVAPSAALQPLQVPRGFGRASVPEDNPPTEAKIALGQRLFFDTSLSSDGTVSCGTCHVPGRAFTDGLPRSRGIGGRTGTRNTPSLFNVGYLPLLLWDGRSPSLEQQAQYPIMHPLEMNMSDKRVVRSIASRPSYAELFRRAFGSTEATFPRVLQALASFERTLVSGDSPFDRYELDDDRAAISQAASRGWDLFRGRAGCIRCHQFDADNRLFTDRDFHNTGVGYDQDTPDLGRFIISRERLDKGKFKTPSLRNVALTAPYMHDGRFQTLHEVIEYYERGGSQNIFLDGKIRPFSLAQGERDAIVEFLKSLTGETATAWRAR